MLCSARELQALRRPRRPARARRRRAGRRGRARGARTSTTRSSRSSSRRTSATACQRLRRRARSRGAHRRAAEVADVRAGAGRRTTRKLPVTIEAPDLCGRFSGRVVRGVNAQAKTPQWMVDRLARCGQRTRLGAGRHLELRDVRARPAVAHLRPRQDPWRPRRALGQARASRSSCSTATPSSVDETRRRHRRRPARSSRSPASWAATRPRCPTTRATSTSRRRSGGPRRSPGRSRRYQLLDRCRPPLRARRRPGDDGRAHRATSRALILEICGGAERGPDRRPDRCSCPSASR